MSNQIETKTVGVGIIGAGMRGVYTLGSRMADLAEETGFRISALCDNNATRLGEGCQRLRQQFAEREVNLDIAPYGEFQAVVDDPDVDLVMITTPQSFHREPALAALRSGKRVYLDKPIAHTLEDAIAIVEEEKRTGNPMMLGFTRRYEAPWRRAYELVQQGAIGDLHMIQIRSIIPYHTYFHRWHRRREWSGGALNDKSSHHMDVFNWFAGSKAVRLSAFGGRRVFLPDADAPERCLDCDRDCPYRVAPTRNLDVAGDPLALGRDSWARAEDVFGRVDTCVYLPGADIKDHATAQIQYENGIIATLFLSFFGPKAEDQETLELVGSSGRIRLTRHTGELDVVRDHGARHQVVDCRDADFGSSHFGADRMLIRDLAAFCAGRRPVVTAQDGYEATRMIMAVHDSIDSNGRLIEMADLPAAVL